MLSISIAIFIWFKVRKIIWSHETPQKNLRLEVFFVLSQKKIDVIIRFFTTNKRKKVWGSIKWAVDRWPPVGRGPSSVNDYPQC
jgi:hypothetical protein